MRVEKLDHVALSVRDPERVAEKLSRRLPFRRLQETDDLLLLGRAPELGKLTLLRAEEPIARGVLLRVGIRVPAAMTHTTLELDDGLELLLVPGPVGGQVEVDHVALGVPDPAASARAWLEHGLVRAVGAAGGGERVRAGHAHVELHRRREPAAAAGAPQLDHLGLLVGSIGQARSHVAERGLALDEVVDADHSRAVFVHGPDGVRVEYIEHKPSFALA